LRLPEERVRKRSIAGGRNKNSGHEIHEKPSRLSRLLIVLGAGLCRVLPGQFLF